MDKEILEIAKNKFSELSTKYDGFINVIVDNWRGYRFVYDTADTRKCQNQCDRCYLYQLLKDEKLGRFSAGLYKASESDKAIFGPQNYLNCKTLAQYKNCFISFITQKINSEKEMKVELDLVFELQIIKLDLKVSKTEDYFRNSIISSLLKILPASKKKWIRTYLKTRNMSENVVN